LALLFTSELLIISNWLDGASLIQGPRLVGFMHDWGAWILRGFVGFGAIFATFAYLKNRSALPEISMRIEQTPFRWSLFAAHCVAMSMFGILSFLLYGGSSGPHSGLLASIWFVAGLAAIAFAGIAFLPSAVWAQLIRGTGYLWVYSLLAVILACFSGSIVRRLWQPASYLTFHLAKIFLGLFVSGIVPDPTTLTIGTRRFQVEIAPQCSGLEGVGLILAFGILWLLIFRKECRFPRSLLLIPIAVTLIFLLNSVRIAALVLIGNAGAERIALGGFHSQAGWIAFSAVGVVFCLVIRHVPWFTAGEHRWESFSTVTRNPSTAAFLLPFLMILAVLTIANATKGTGGLDWLYPLRFFAAAGTLWVFRRSYAGMIWKCDWLAPAIGALVFLIWIGLDRSNPGADRQMSAALLAPAGARVTWIVFRVLAAVVTVPLAEELAFRGYLMRRLLSRDFALVSFQRFSWLALLASSVAFGLLHGGFWIAGGIAGILFGLAVIRRGRILDAVMAHASANALLAVYVLASHKWHLW
jgi:exosortase E/protease (VPEID-CTERM system)